MEHFRLGDDVVTSVDIKGKVGGNRPNLPTRNRYQHAQYLQERYAEVKSYVSENRERINIDKELLAEGIYMEMSVAKNSVDYSSIDNTRGARLMNVKESVDDEDGQIDVTLFIPSSNNEWLDNKIEDYKVKNTNKGNPKNRQLIESVNDLQVTSVVELLTQVEDRKKYADLPSEAPYSYELWMIREDKQWDENLFHKRMEALGIQYGGKVVQFANTTIALVEAKKSQLEALPFVIEALSEIRLYRTASVLLSVNSPQDRYEWVELIRQSVIETPNKQRVGILDSGVCNHHGLLLNYLPDDRMHNATLSKTNQDKVHNGGHGTLMAGIVLYGDLSDAVNQKGPIEVSADLSSVKIYVDRSENVNNLDDDNKETKDLFYAAIAEDAIMQARNDEANILCSAITTEGVCHGDPSAWSGAIDQTLYNNGEAKEIIFLAAGNVEDTLGLNYPDFNRLTEPKDPAQSWNAITVGAYTRKCAISDTNYIGRNPIAPADGLSPYSPTTNQWSNGLIKPEILMEGGNAILETDGSLSSAPDDLVLASTGRNITGNTPFDAFYATSAAAAMAAHLAAKVAAANPDLSPLSIRALIVHSAEWTDEMKQMFSNNNKPNYKDLVHSCGYGVPNEAKAIASDGTYATFISEQTLKCLMRNTKAPNKYKLGQMHIYEMPWPQEFLESMHEEEVTLKITLSYYIDPAPGAKTRLSKYQYPSMSLRFDVNMPTETLEQFQARVSNIIGDGVETMHNDSTRWTIGINARNHGSIISDSIRATAADIASCRYISVSPKYGWWKNRRYTEDREIDYSLVVSLETTESDICAAIAQPIAVEVL